MSLLLTTGSSVAPPRVRRRLRPLPRPAVEGVAFDKSHYATGEMVTATITFDRAITTNFGPVAPKLVLKVDDEPLELSGTALTDKTLTVQGTATGAVAAAGQVTWGIPQQILPFWKSTLAGDARVKITSNDGWSMNGVTIRWIDGAVTVRQPPLFINPVPTLAVPVHERISCYYGESNQYWRFVNYPDMPFHPGLDFDTDDQVETPCVAAHDGYIIAQTPTSRGWTIYLYFEDGGRHFVLHYTHLVSCAFNNGQEIPWNFSDRTRPVVAGDFMGNIGRVAGYDPLPLSHLHTQLAEYNAAGDMIAASLDPAPHFGVAPRTTLEVNSGWTEYTIKLPLLDTAGTLTRQATVREIVTMLTDRYGGNAGLFWIRAITQLLSGDGSTVIEGDGSVTLKGYLPVDGRRVIANSEWDITDAENGQPATLTFTDQNADVSGLSFN